jgi:O-antigen ligase
MPYVLAALIGLTALILVPGQLFYFDVTPKFAVLLAGMGLLPLIGKPKLERRFSLLLLASVGAVLLSAAFSTNRALAVSGSTWRRYGLASQIAVLAFAMAVAATRNRRVVVGGIAIASAIAAAYGIGQYFGWDPILPASSYHIGEGIWTIVRPPGTFGYVSYFATWLLMAGFLSLTLETRAGYAVAGLCWMAMMLTGTRAAMAGLAVGLVVWLWRRGFRLPRRALVAGALCVVAAAGFYFSPAGWNLRSRSRWFAEDRFGGARPLLWRDSFAMALHRLPTGYGPETFTADFARTAESLELARAYPDFLHESPHNMFLDALVSEGLPGLLCLAALCWFGLRHGRPLEAAALAAGIVAQQFTVFTIPTALLFYVTLALCTPAPKESAMRLNATALLILPLGLYAWRAVSQDHALELTRRDLNAGNVEAARTHYRSGADLWYSRALFSVAQRAPDLRTRIAAMQLARAAAERATVNAEDPFDAWYNLAMIRAEVNDAPGSEAALRKSIEARPNWFKPHWVLAQLLGSLEEAQKAVECDGGKHREVAQTLEELRNRPRMDTDGHR